MKVSSFLLSNGADLSFAEYGSSGGRTVLLLHGLIGSVVSEYLEKAFCEKPVRVLALARPGYGASGYFKMRETADWGRQLESFLDFMKLDEFDVIGISAGAPYAYSLAALFPGRVRQIFINSGVPAVYLAEILKQYPLEDVAAYAAFHKETRREAGEALYEAYRESLTEEMRQSRDFKDSLCGTLENIGQEAKLQCRPWGFPLENILCPVTLIHGTEDSEVPFRAAQEMAKLLPHARLVRLDGEEHVSLAAAEWLLQELMEGTPRRLSSLNSSS